MDCQMLNESSKLPKVKVPDVDLIFPHGCECILNKFFLLLWRPFEELDQFEQLGGLEFFTLGCDFLCTLVVKFIKRKRSVGHVIIHTIVEFSNSVHGKDYKSNVDRIGQSKVLLESINVLLHPLCV